MKILLIIVFFLYINDDLIRINAHKHSDKPLLFLISFDGFRWDYLNKYDLPNFKSLKKNSSHADFIYNQFVTATFPNHFSIITGLTEESHGIVQNSMFDRTLNKSFQARESDSKTLTDWFGQNPSAMPVWTLNQKAGDGRKSASNWIGSNAIINNVGIMAVPYNQSAPFKDLVDQFINFFVSPIDPVNFAALYFYEPDYTGHFYGPDSEQVKDKLEEIDDILGYLIKSLREHHLYDKLNLIITSDHGMEKISKSTAIYLKDYVDVNLFDGYGSPACYNLFVKNQSNIDIVYNKLKVIDNIDVFKKDQIPESLKYKQNVRIGDIVIIAKLYYSIWKEPNPKIDWDKTNGMHGYYNNHSSMYPIFIAHGPAFKENYRINSFKTVDLYPLMCLLLGLEPGFNQGVIENVFDMLIYKEIDIRGKNLLLLGIIPIGLMATTLLVLFFYCRFNDNAQKRTNVNYTILSPNNVSMYELEDQDDKDNLLFSRN